MRALAKVRRFYIVREKGWESLTLNWFPTARRNEQPRQDHLRRRSSGGKRSR